MQKIKTTIILILCFIIYTDCSCQKLNDTIKKDTTARVFHPGRFKAVVISEATVWGGSLFFFYNLWYKDFPQSSFHFFNDNGEWLQADKFGHATTSYSISSLGYETFKWTGVSDKKAIWFGGTIGILYESVIEILDGFSAGWGFSIGDECANTFGAAMFLSQQSVWKEQRIIFKRSYHNTQYPQYHPDLLGGNFLEKVNKDYNGLTFWLSGNIHSFLKEDSKFPRWLNIDVGYGVEGLVGANDNSTASQDGSSVPYFKRYRQFYFSPDVNFTKIRTKSKFMKKVFWALNVIKFPAPALEYSKEKKLRVIPVYF